MARPLVPKLPSWIRQLHATSSAAAARPITIASAPLELTRLEAFRQHAYIPKKPLLFSHKAGSPTSSLPAANKWFQEVDNGDATAARSISPYMERFQEWPFPYELVVSTPRKQEALASFRDWLLSGNQVVDQLLAEMLEATIAELGSRSFFQVSAPLRLLLKALEFNRTRDAAQSESLELYIAQSGIPELPAELQEDLATPELVQRAGKGDVYGSSVWLGTEPTYTPLHRDPNPNIFGQLCGRKVIRLMEPARGDRLFAEVQARIRQNSNSRIRAFEMMEGKEREALHEAIWEHDPLPDGLYEAELGPRDALFIPYGWWHSVKSVGTSGNLNGSVNWWFR